MRSRRFLFEAAAILSAVLLHPGPAPAQFTITEIIDATGDGAGHGLDRPEHIAVDAAGNVYVAGRTTNNAFKITPGGVITEIIDATGDGAGNHKPKKRKKKTTRLSTLLKKKHMTRLSAKSKIKQLVLKIKQHKGKIS